MRKAIVLSLCIAAFSFFSSHLRAQNTNVLFVGNSYVYTNNLHLMLQLLAQSGGRTVTVDLSAPGGHTFNQHTNNTTTLSKIASGNWDFVILQEQSQIPSFPPSQVQSQCYPFAERLDSLIHAADSCAKTVFFMTWGRKYGDASNCPNYPPLCTFDGMQARLRQSYIEMAQDNQAIVAPVGQAFKYSRMADSTINLYSSDNSHPSVAGTYLAACVFYETLFQESPVGLSYIANLPANQAAFLQNIAHQTVTDSLLTWQIGAYQTQSAFSFTQNGSDFTFQNNSTDSRDYLWDFGDGNTSVLENPVHTYATAGSFNVTLTSALRCTSDVSTQNILITSLNPITKEKISLIKTGSKTALLKNIPETQSWMIFSAEGKMVQNGQGSNVQTNLDAGLYFILLNSSPEPPFIFPID
jgi:hypothetical protein